MPSLKDANMSALTGQEPATARTPKAPPAPASTVEDTPRPEGRHAEPEVAATMPNRDAQAMRAAYALTYFTGTPGQRPPTFRVWQEDALRDFAALPPRRRKALVGEVPETPGRRTRQVILSVTPETLERIETARAADARAAGQPISRARWVAAALRVAVEAVREKHGELPPPPRSLPRDR